MNVYKKAMALLLAALLCLALPSCQEQQPATGQTKQNTTSTQVDYAPTAYDGSPYVEVNNNIPDFPASDYTTTSFERYGKLDKLGRCTTAYANIGRDLMPTEKRGDISQIKPSGWHSVRYDCVEGKSLYNRCHLIGYQLTAENANEQNLITGTRYLNTEGMLPFENMVADYIKETGNHVLYRVTPIYNGDNLVADGVQMEARSVEDDGEGITYHVYCYNVQPGVGIDYATGDQLLGQHAKGHQAGEAGHHQADQIRPEHQHHEVPQAGLLRRGEDEQGQPPQRQSQAGEPHPAGLQPLRPVQTVGENKSGKTAAAFPLGALPLWVEQNGVYGKNCGRNRKKGLRFPGKIVYIIMIGCFLI